MSSPHSWGDAFPDPTVWQGHTILAIAKMLQQTGFRVVGNVDASGVVTLKFFTVDDDSDLEDEPGGSDGSSSDEEPLPVYHN